MSECGQQPVIATQPGCVGDQDQHGPPGRYPSQEVRVRAMNASDCDFVGSLVIEAFRAKCVHNIGTENLPLAKEAYAEDLRLSPAKYSRFLVAEMGGQRAGMIELRHQGDTLGAVSDRWDRLDYCSQCRMWLAMSVMNEKVPRGHCYVETVCVDEGFRGKGIGKALMAAADQQARSNNCHTIYLLVAFDNRAQKLYSREGYRVTATKSGCGLFYFATGVKYFKKMEKTL